MAQNVTAPVQADEVVIVEPKLDLDLSVVVYNPLTDDRTTDSDNQGDAGDTIEYTLDISNTSGVDAFDINLSTLLPAQFEPNGTLSIEVITADTSDSLDNVANKFEIVTVADPDSTTGGTRPKLQLKSGENIDILDTETLKLRINGSVSTTAVTGSGITAPTELTWSSIDGVRNQTIDATTDPSQYADNDTERDGSSGTDSDTALNNYYTEDGVSQLPNPDGSDGSDDLQDLISLSGIDPTILKTIPVTSEAATPLPTNTNTTVSNTPTPVAIGEVVTYRLAVTMPEGVNKAVTITDLIPEGMEYIANSAVLKTTGLEGYDDLAFTGDFPKLKTTLDAAVDPDSLTFTFVDDSDALKDVVITGNNRIQDNTFFIEYQAIVKNVAANQDSAVPKEFVETATLSLNDPAGNPITNASGQPFRSNEAKAIVTEPQVNVKTFIINAAGNPQDADGATPPKTDGGIDTAVPKTPTDTATVRIVIDAPAGDDFDATAFDLQMLNALPAGLTFAGNLKLISGNVPDTLTYDPAQKRVRANFDAFPDGGQTIIEFDVIVSDPDPSTAANIVNPATITYTSLSTDNSPNERDGDDGIGAGLNNYADSDPAEISINTPPDTNDAVYSNVVAGSTIPLNGTKLGGSDPDTPSDATNTVESYIINTLPPASQGVVYLGAPSDNKPLTVGQELTPAELQTLQFVATANFVDTTFTYSAKDTIGAIDQTPGTVYISSLNIPPETEDKTYLINPDQTPDAGDPPNVIAPIQNDGNDPDGTVANYRIDTLPDATDGVLFFDADDDNIVDPGEAIEEGALIPAGQVTNIKFKAAATFDGAEFKYSAVDAQGVPDPTRATVTFQAPPQTTGGSQVVEQGQEVPLTNLVASLGTDPDGTVRRFRITSLGNVEATDGKLYLGSVSPANEISVGQEIEAGDIDSLIFVAANGFNGATFEFAAIDNHGNIDATPATFELLIAPETNDAVGELSSGEIIQLSAATGTGGSTMTTQLSEGTDPDKVAADKRPTQYRIDVATITEGKLYLNSVAAANEVTQLPGYDAATNTVTIAAADLANLFFQADSDFVGGVAIEYVAIDEDGLADPTPGTIYLNPPGTNIPPDTNDSAEEIPPGETAQIPGLGGTDPDDPTRDVKEFVITDLSGIEATDGKLYYGDPDDPTAIEIVPYDPAVPTSGTRIPLADIDKIYFKSENGFNGATFKYAAIDNDNVIDPTPATVTLTTPPETTGGKQSIQPDTVNFLNQFPATPGIDPDGGAIVKYRITELPDTADGTLYIGNPNQLGAIEVSAGQDLTPAQLANLYFDANPGFNGGAFEYAAIDDEGSIDLTPAVYTLNGPPETNDASGRVDPGNAIALAL
ncbi:MAG: hypothetical protein HC795_02740, partial [Coleofasciculaceae cyanobacterium RL_1_1]|nr:hypothetical protein [Coleofasciculaceae cyanobacterium RL_1_1]